MADPEEDPGVDGDHRAARHSSAGREDAGALRWAIERVRTSFQNGHRAQDTRLRAKAAVGRSCCGFSGRVVVVDVANEAVQAANGRVEERGAAWTLADLETRSWPQRAM